MSNIDPKNLALYMSLKPEPNTNLDREEAKVTIFNGGITYKGEHTTLKGNPHILDLPTREAHSIRMIQGGGNLLSQLKGTLEDMAGGPWTANGRDGKLTIKNRNYNQRPIASFTYAGGHGELLTFTAKTTRTEKTLDTSESSDIDPDDKTLNNTQAQGLSDETSSSGVSAIAPDITSVGGRLYFSKGPGYANPEGVYPSNVESWLADRNNPKKQEKQNGKNITRIKAYNDQGVKNFKKSLNDNFEATEEQSQQYMAELRAKHSELLNKIKEGDTEAMKELLSTSSLPKFTIKRRVWVTKWVDPKDLSQYNSHPNGRASSGQTSFGQTGGANYDPVHRYNEGYRLLEKGQIPNMRMIPKDQAVNWDGKGRKPHYTLWDRVKVASFEEVEVPIDGARIVSSARPPDPTNAIVKSIQEEITGTMRIVGHPTIESEKLLEIKNVSKRYSGEWYITNIKHRVDASGYHCDIQAIKKGSTIVTNVVSSSTNLNSMYAKINNLAEARAARNSAGIGIRSAFLNSVDKYREDEAKKGNVISDDASFILVGTPEARDKWGNYNPTKHGPVAPGLPVYPAENDVVNVDKERPRLKAEAEELRKKQEQANAEKRAQEAQRAQEEAAKKKKK